MDNETRERLQNVLEAMRDPKVSAEIALAYADVLLTQVLEVEPAPEPELLWAGSNELADYQDTLRGFGR